MRYFVRQHRWSMMVAAGVVLFLMQAQDRDIERNVLLFVLLLGLGYASHLRQQLHDRTQRFHSAAFIAKQQQRVLDEHAIVSSTDPQGTITYVNDKFIQISGYSRQELLGRNHRIVKSGQQGFLFYETLWKTLLSGESWHGQILNRAKNGETYWLESTIMPFLNEQGEVYQYTAICTDITAQKKMQDQVKSSRWLLQNVMDTLGEGVYMLDANGFCTYVNREAERILGWTSDELMGKNLHDVIHCLLPDGGHLPASECPVHLSMKNGRIYRSENEHFLNKAGELFPVSMVASPIDHGRGMVGSVAAFQDITERKQAEKELLRAKEAAEAASKAKGDFLATMSHEIRTPMNGIIGMTELALDTALSNEQREYLELVRSSADSLLSIINDILDFSKIESGKIELEEIDFPIRDLLASTLKPLSLRAMGKGLELVYDVDEGVPHSLVGDPGRLRQVLTNLVGNAIKFSDQGEIVVCVSLLEQHAERITLKFSVEDQGVGIPADKQPLIFEAFTQADTSTTRKYGGTGLGLAISRQLVSSMGGEIQLESEEGVGSTFFFTLQLTVGRLAEESHALENLPTLVVDDNATNRRYFEKALRGFGLCPTVVDSAQAALDELARAQQSGMPYQLVLLDVCMPDMDGYDLAEKIQAVEAYHEIKLIMLSSAGARNDVARCAELGIARYLIKPVSHLELRASIETVLSKPRPPEVSKPVVAQPQATGLHILLAEDNAVNQRLAVTLLEKWGHQVEIAENGFVAVQKSSQKAFDLILMDVQMPEMSGLEATHLIREFERHSGQHVPIVAMTANAMTEDRELCLQAGMDDYLSKPLKADKFAALIRKFQLNLLSMMPNFDYVQALQAADQEIVSIIAGPFLEDCSAQMDKLAQAIAARHLPTLKMVAHSFKGLIGNFNAEPVQQIVLQMEQLIAAENVDALAAEYEKLQRAMALLQDALRNFIAAQ